MAAFENVSKVTLNTFGSHMSMVDIRRARLPSENPDPNVPQSRFDPRKYREPRKPIRPFMAYFNILRTMSGAGMLGLPLAISQTGIVLGPIVCVAIGILVIHTHLMLLDCLNEVSRLLKIPHISYRYGFRLALLKGPRIFSCCGEYGPSVIAVFMVLSQIGICTVFVIFTADSLKDIMDWDSINPALLSLFLPYLLLEFLMKDLNIVSYVSLAGNFLAMIGFILILYHIFATPHGELKALKADSMTFLFALGTFLFNMSLVGVVLSLDRSLEDPKVLIRRFGAIPVGISVATAVCTIFGSLGYWSFGTMEENILRSLPYDDYSSMVIIGLYLLTVGFSYPLQCYPGVQIMIEVIKNYEYETPLDDDTIKWLGYIARPTFVLLTFFIAYMIPFQGPFVAFVGNLCTTMLAIVFPATMQLCLLYPNHYGTYRIYLFKNIFLIIMGCVSWLFGVVLSAKYIYIRILAARSPNEYGYF